MDLSELKGDLLSKMSRAELDLYRYFSEKLFPWDNTPYERRSFDDLIMYYGPKGVTEKMLVQALYEAGFTGLICNEIHKIVFFIGYPREIGVLGYSRYSYAPLEDDNVDSKYNVTYLMNLFNEIYEKELSQ